MAVGQTQVLACHACIDLQWTLPHVAAFVQASIAPVLVSGSLYALANVVNL